MLIDRKHGPWAVACAIAAVAALALYVPYHLRALNGPSGGSVPGLIFGGAGFGILLFVGLLGARRSVPTWRIGRAETWMRGHLWLGLLGAGLILLHAGFRTGGPLTTVMMALLGVLTASGLIGLALQHLVPRSMTLQAPMETIHDQIEHVAAGLRAEAVERVGAAEPLKEFFQRHLEGWLSGAAPRGPLADPVQAARLFEVSRAALPAAHHDTLADLREICDEMRQLRRQKTMHHWLHGWLLVHVPLSYAFLVLAIVHAFASLEF